MVTAVAVLVRAVVTGVVACWCSDVAECLLTLSRSTHNTQRGSNLDWTRIKQTHYNTYATTESHYAHTWPRNTRKAIHPQVISHVMQIINKCLAAATGTRSIVSQ